MSTKEKKVEVETTDWVDALVETIWKGYEVGLSSLIKQLEEKEEAYLRALSTARNVTQEYRTHLEGTVHNVTKVNRELLDGLSLKNEEVAAAAEKEDDSNKSPFQNVVKKWEELAWSPWKYTVSLLERAEKQFEENNKEWVQLLRAGRHSWTSLAGEYIDLTKKNQQVFLKTQVQQVQTLVG